MMRKNNFQKATTGISDQHLVGTITARCLSQTGVLVRYFYY